MRPRSTSRLLAASILSCVLAAKAYAAEPAGCDAFRWPSDPIRAVLQGEAVPLTSGGTTPFVAGKALQLKLQPQTAVTLPVPPQKPPRNSAPFAGTLAIAAPATPGSYAVAMSAGGWIEAIQDGKSLRTVAFSGATGCTGLRKIVVFAIEAKPLTLQLSDVASELITIAILQAP
jgi:hypothetical protein